MELEHNTLLWRSRIHFTPTQSHSIEVDTVVMDLEDSVAEHRKGAAREALFHGIQASPEEGPEVAVRINAPSGNQTRASDDLELLLPLRQLECIVIPKVEHDSDIFFVIQRAQQLRPEGCVVSLAAEDDCMYCRRDADLPTLLTA